MSDCSNNDLTRQKNHSQAIISIYCQRKVYYFYERSSSPVVFRSILLVVVSLIAWYIFNASMAFVFDLLICCESISGATFSDSWKHRTQHHSLFILLLARRDGPFMNH